jgi:hypothetical protein
MSRALWALLLIGLLARPALAQKQAALELYREGVALTQRGEYRNAIAAFERSLAAYPHDNTLYALGEAHRRLGQLRESFKYYSRYAERLEGKARDEFQAKLRRLREQAVSTLTVTTDPPGATIWIDGRESGRTASPLRLEVRAGRHRLRAALNGHADVQGALKAELGEPINLHLHMGPRVDASSTQPSPARPGQAQPSSSTRSWFLGAAVGPAVAGYGDSSLSVGASLDVSLDLGHLWQLGRLGVLVGLTTEVAPVTDTIADDRAAFVGLLPTVGGRLLLGAGLWLELRFGLGLAVLADAGPKNFLVRGSGGSGTYLGLAVQPSLKLGWTFWRGLALVLTPGALDYNPRLGGFADLAPGIGPIVRYHGSLGLAWMFGAGGR